MTESELALIKKIGLPQKITCQELGISDVALRCRLHRLIIKYGVENKTALAIKAIKSGTLRAEDFEIRDW